MRYISATTSFASTHLHPDCGPHLHGHTFTVTVTERGTDDGVRAELRPDLEALVAELHLHDLREMLVGGSQSLDGIAAWIMERLLIRHPRIVNAEVSIEPAVRVGVGREIR